MTTTLVVSCDRVLGDRIADALEQVGGDVMWCRGPAGEDCVCPATRGKACALTGGVDAVVLDTTLANDGTDHGFRARQLVEYYERLALPLVALIADRSPAPFGPRTLVLPRDSEAIDVVAAVLGAIAHRRSTAGFRRPA